VPSSCSCGNEPQIYVKFAEIFLIADGLLDSQEGLIKREVGRNKPASKGEV
jgi:hypothetical protein